jgi:hypothetical protein
LEEDIALLKVNNHFELKIESGIKTVTLADLTGNFAEYQTLVTKGLAKQPTFDETSAMIGKEIVAVGTDKPKQWEQVQVGWTNSLVFPEFARILTKRASQEMNTIRREKQREGKCKTQQATCVVLGNKVAGLGIGNGRHSNVMMDV